VTHENDVILVESLFIVARSYNKLNPFSLNIIAGMLNRWIETYITDVIINKFKVFNHILNIFQN
jgi:hypothetical protein